MADKDKKNQDMGQKQIQEAFDEAEDKGYFGTAVDPTPNENYTLQGVVDNKPTPENDPELKAMAGEALTKAEDSEEGGKK